MHIANHIFWKYTAEKFPDFFNGDIIEFGSYNINGTIRGYFNNCKRYVGVDWRNGPGVDTVGLAHEVSFDFKAKAVLSASMLEHDPYWEKSLGNMIDHLQPDGILVLTWGSARNGEHCLEEAPDGKFHCLKAQKVIKFLSERKIKIHTTVYDGELDKIIRNEGDLKRWKLAMRHTRKKTDGFGEFNLVAFNSANELKDGFITVLQEEDK